MIIGKKMRVLPTEEQEILFRKSCGVARWAYNYFLSEKQRVYEEWKKDNTKQSYINNFEVRKEITKLKKKNEYLWLNEVGSNVIKQAVRDADYNIQKFFKEQAKYPKFKKRGKVKESFYINYETMKRKSKNIMQCEKIGKIRLSEEIPELRDNSHYKSPRISYDGKYWYLSFSYDTEDLVEYKEEKVELTANSYGIDLGLKDLVILSNQDATIQKNYKNINKTREIKRLEKKLKREQRKFSRRIENNIKCYEEYKPRKPIYKRDLQECKNIQKQKSKIKLIYRKIKNIRTNYIHQITSEIVKTKPFQIVMEDLKIKNLMKNKYLSKSIQNAKWYEIRLQLKHKCKKYKIDFIIVPFNYPSSKTCSRCGNIKKDLKLKDRIYHCEHCGLIIDRDYNASLNLANYNLK